MSRYRMPRLRMFAGPNGSGKTSLIQGLAREFSDSGVFSVHHLVNADELERALSDEGIDLGAFGVELDRDLLCAEILAGGRVPSEHPFFSRASLEGRLLRAPRDACDSYVAASIADFLREELVASGLSLTFETVMSHVSKVDFLQRARAEGFRTYLYFVCTETPELNVGRVRTRVATGGHPVSEEKIVERWHRSLELLPQALAHADRAFLFDNSGEAPVWIAEFSPEGVGKVLVAEGEVPGWFRRVLPKVG